MGKEVAVNTIILIPTLKKRVRSIQLLTNMLIEPDLKLCFNILYETNTLGLLYGITFILEYVFRTGPITIPNLLTNLNQNGMNTTTILTSPPTIWDENYNKYIFRTVDLNHSPLDYCPPRPHQHHDLHTPRTSFQLTS